MTIDASDPDGRSPADAAFCDELLEHGLLLPAGVEGLYLRSAGFESVVRAVGDLVSGMADDWAQQRFFLPPIVGRAAFEASDYARSFPNLLGSVSVFRGGDAEHAELIKAVEDGRDWSAWLEPAEVLLSSAACHAVYPLLDPQVPEGGTRLEVQGYCFRHEPSGDPARMQSFRMQELVLVGTPQEALAHRDDYLQRGIELLSALGLDVSAVPADDPFFGRAGRLLSASQRASELKFEIVCTVSSVARPTAIASANYHQDHFGVPFGLRTPDGVIAHSACIGFGLERITLALLRRHGTTIASWPSSVRDMLWP